MPLPREDDDVLRRGWRHRGAELAHQVRTREYGIVFRLLSWRQARIEARNLGRPIRLMKESQRLAPRHAALLPRRIDDAVQRRNPTIVGPALHQIAEVDDESAGDRRHGNPRPVARGDLEALRALLRQKDRQTAV